MIRTFRNKDTQAIFEGKSARRFRAVEERAHDRLQALHSATSLEDLRAIRSNRLETLRGNRKGQFSIRVNDQYRICFSWRGTEAFDVELVDYH